MSSAGVTLDHLMAVGAEGFGSFPSEIDVQNVGGGTVHDVIVNDPCGGTAAGAEYGINVFGSGPVEVSDNRAMGGFSDAGIYIGGITDTNGSTLRVVRNGTYLNHQGIIIENSGPPGRILVANNRIHHNIIGGGEVEEATGLFIHNSDRVAIRDNVIRNNSHFGVNIDAPSDHNRLIENVITDNPIDLNNEGSANCGFHNTIGTRRGNPLVPCT